MGIIAPKELKRAVSACIDFESNHFIPRFWEGLNRSQRELFFIHLLEGASEIAKNNANYNQFLYASNGELRQIKSFWQNQDYGRAAMAPLLVIENLYRSNLIDGEIYKLGINWAVTEMEKIAKSTNKIPLDFSYNLPSISFRQLNIEEKIFRESGNIRMSKDGLMAIKPPYNEISISW